ncbi:MAG: His/Gly/Thr/Pro-type tRNA ligase C-terminal domain-containing protein [Dolichospermum sp.]
MLVVGRKEATERTVSIRRFGSQDQTMMSLDDAVAMLVKEATPPDMR